MLTDQLVRNYAPATSLIVATDSGKRPLRTAQAKGLPHDSA